MRILTKFALFSTLAMAGPLHARGAEVHVKSGQSIQQAIDHALPGSRITVEKGTYYEQLLISKDGIALIGEDAILVPPGYSTANICTGLATSTTSMTGICVVGQGVVFDGPYTTEHRKVLSVARPVKNVRVRGFTVKDFDGVNIAVIGGQDVVVKCNNLINGGGYGALAHFSCNTRIVENVITSEDINRFIGICTNDTSPSHVLRNKVTGYNVGLCTQTNGAQYRRNVIRSACAGVFVDPGINGATISHNDIGANSADCATAFGFVTGIFLYGASNTLVKSNNIHDQKLNGQAAGISVVDANALQLTSNDHIEDNTLSNNDYDIYVQSTGAGNVFKQNSCKNPANLCS